MKYAIIIADGAADRAIDELGNRTPLEAARTPNLDAWARCGLLATAATTPPGFSAGSDVCTMSLLGYDPARYRTGRAPLEAAALGLTIGEGDWIFRVNLVTVGSAGTPDAGRMLDHSAGAISDAEARALDIGLAEYWRAKDPGLARDLSISPGVSYRNILVDASAARGADRDYARVATTPPHEIPGLPWAEHLPRTLPDAGGSKPSAEAARALNRLMALSAEFLPSHPVNTSRVAKGLRPANMAWIWGQGRRPTMAPFSNKLAITGPGAMITPVDLLAGIAALIGWDRLTVPGMTGYHDNDYAAQGRAAGDAFERYDVVCCHVESPDEAAHQGDWKTKVAAIEAIDEHVVGPVAAALGRLGAPGEAWRMLVMPDHYTLVSTRKHDPTPPPLLIVGAGARPTRAGARLTERCAHESGLRFDPGHGLMERFLEDGRSATSGAAHDARRRNP